MKEWLHFFRAVASGKFGAASTQRPRLVRRAARRRDALPRPHLIERRGWADTFAPQVVYTAYNVMVPNATRLLLCLPLAAGAFAQSPAFGPLLSLPAQHAPLAIASADFNGDGLQDIAIANTGVAIVSVFLGSGGGKFTSAASVTLPSGCDAAYLAAGNFTGASSPDLLTVCALGGVVVLPNTGAGTFGRPLSTSLPAPAFVGNLMLGDVHPAIADFNGDGNLDIAVPTYGLDLLTSSGGWYLLLGKGNGSFQSPSSLPVLRIYTALARRGRL